MTLGEPGNSFEWSAIATTSGERGYGPVFMVSVSPGRLLQSLESAKSTGVSGTGTREPEGGASCLPGSGRSGWLKCPGANVRNQFSRVESCSFPFVGYSRPFFSEISVSLSMDLFSNPSDDQVALMGCAAALLFSGGLMYVSFFVGRMRQTENTKARSIPMAPVQKTDSDSSERKAA